MKHLIRYLKGLSRGRIILWCYAIWYVVNVSLHFDPRPRLWLTSLGLSFIIGIALILSTVPTGQPLPRLATWQTFRLFLMPFCVSSFAALVKDEGYFLIFPPSVHGNLAGIAWIALFLLMVLLLQDRKKPAQKP